MNCRRPPWGEGWRRLAAALAGVALLAFAGAATGGEPAAQPEVAIAELPPQARETIALIRKGGPFPYGRDGAVFGNLEKKLPVQARGHYREYTVRTPGAKNRGARRIVAGREGELYYTEDHYRSFRRIKEP